MRWLLLLFPTLTCGVFVFSSVSAASPARPPASSLTHSPTHSLTHSFNHSLNVHFAWQAWHNVHCQGVGCTPWRPLGLRLFCVAGVVQCALPRGRMYALASLGSPPLLRGRRGTMCAAKGSDVRPGVPWVSASFAWQAWHNVHCQGVGCTPWRPLGLRLFCVAGVAQCALPRGRMYALASLGSPPLLRGRHGTMCTAKGSDVRPGVPWVSASFAWQAWRIVHCQGVGCTPWRPLGLRLFCVAGVAQCALPRGRMYALASLGSPSLLRGRRGTMCTAKGSDVRPGVTWVSASFARQAWDNVRCQGVGCTPWRPLGSASFAWQAWDNVHCQGGRMYALASLGLRLFCVAGVGQCAFCVAGVGQCALPRDRMYGLESLGLRLFCVAGVGQCAFCVAGVGQCALPRGLDVRPGVPWAPLLLRGRRGTMCILRGRRGTMCMYALASLGLRLFCVAGVGQCALPRGWSTAWRPLGSASFAWQALTHSFTHSVTHSLTPLTPSHSLTHTPLLAHSHSLTLSHSLTHSLTDTLSHTHTLNDRWMDGWMDRWTLT